MTRLGYAILLTESQTFFQDKLGKDCTKFNSCDHVFCKDCIRDYFTVKIKDGTVLSIKCPDTECTSEADPTQVSKSFKFDSVIAIVL